MNLLESHSSEIIYYSVPIYYEYGLIFEKITDINYSINSACLFLITYTIYSASLLK